MSGSARQRRRIERHDPVAELRADVARQAETIAALETGIDKAIVWPGGAETRCPGCHSPLTPDRLEAPGAV